MLQTTMPVSHTLLLNSCNMMNLMYGCKGSVGMLPPIACMAVRRIPLLLVKTSPFVECQRQQP